MAFGAYFIFFKEDKETTLTLAERRWIEDNRNEVIDLGITSDLPIYNYEGEGLILDFVKELEDLTGLEFNKTIDTSSDYAFQNGDYDLKKDILVFEDYKVLVTKENKHYTSPSQIPEMVIGVVEKDLEKDSQILNNPNLSYKAYASEEALIEELTKENSEVNGILIWQTKNLDTILEKNLSIACSLVDDKSSYFFKLGKEERLNSIIKKVYQKWYEESYEDSYQVHFNTLYTSLKKISDQQSSEFRSKQYTYGFVENIPYDSLSYDRLIGANYHLVRNFYKLTNVEINYEKYKNYEDMKKAFDQGKIDFMFDPTSYEKYDQDFYRTIGIYDTYGVILSHLEEEIHADTLNGLTNKTVMTVKNSQIEKKLKEKGIQCKSYDSVEDMLKHKEKDSILALDNASYAYYQRNDLTEYKQDFTFSLDSYPFTIKKEKNNQLLEELFNFYISFANTKEIMNLGLANYYEHTLNLSFIKTGILYILSMIGLLCALNIIIQKIKRFRRRNSRMTKEEKIKYIDQLTSLKNRAYLNDHVKIWDNNDVYPQSIIVVDLNNLAYINDNYGHEEGDRVIQKAANILIKNQIINSDIIRTSGNEFLIYLVGFDEKQIVAYIKRLHKEFKELPHEFGAAIGYSMIKDEIKTFDDAINEATLAMKNNKEETRK